MLIGILTATLRNPSSPEVPSDGWDPISCRMFGAAERQRPLASSPPFPGTPSFGLQLQLSGAVQQCNRAKTLFEVSLKLLCVLVRVRQSPEKFPRLFHFVKHALLCCCLRARMVPAESDLFWRVIRELLPHQSFFSCCLDIEAHSHFDQCRGISHSRD